MSIDLTTDPTAQCCWSIVDRSLSESDALLGAGLPRLLDTAQPATPIIDSHGAAALAGNRLIRLVPLGCGRTASLVADLAHIGSGAGPAGGPQNPLSPAEIAALAHHLQILGGDVTETRSAAAQWVSPEPSQPDLSRGPGCVTLR
ncbi:hypothetical protein PJI20_10045 [Mycobacterium kansasii]